MHLLSRCISSQPVRNSFFKPSLCTRVWQFHRCCSMQDVFSHPDHAHSRGWGISWFRYGQYFNDGIVCSENTHVHRQQSDHHSEYTNFGFIGTFTFRISREMKRYFFCNVFPTLTGSLDEPSYLANDHNRIQFVGARLKSTIDDQMSGVSEGSMWHDTYGIRSICNLTGERRWWCSDGCEYSLFRCHLQCGRHRMGFWWHHNHSIGMFIDSRSLDVPSPSTITFFIHKQFELSLLFVQSVIIKLYPIHLCNYHNSSGVIKRTC